jgi:hypothetical protein
MTFSHARIEKIPPPSLPSHNQAQSEDKIGGDSLDSGVITSARQQVFHYLTLKFMLKNQEVEIEEMRDLGSELGRYCLVHRYTHKDEYQSTTMDSQDAAIVHVMNVMVLYLTPIE